MNPAIPEAVNRYLMGYDLDQMCETFGVQRADVLAAAGEHIDKHCPELHAGERPKVNPTTADKPVTKKKAAAKKRRA